MFDRLPFFLVLQVWRGDVWHAGAGYSEMNTRLHFYIDSPLVERDPNYVYTGQKVQEVPQSTLEG